MSYDLPPEIRVYEVKPGDTVFCQLAHAGDRERMDKLADELKQIWPYAHVVVADGDTRLQVLREGESRR